MTSRRLSAIGVASAIVSMVAVSACAQTTMPSATGATYGASANRPAAPIEAIRQAPDPSATIEAYAKGVAVEPATDALREAFIQRMVEFGVPAMAESQARELVNRRPSNGLAWAVLAYADAARGQLMTAVDNISHAVHLLPNDEFVQRTAGQLLAWYDTMADLPKVPDATKRTVQRVRTTMTGKAAFNETSPFKVLNTRAKVMW
jgi:Flp pilus assembly protein TadD